ncbi:MAG: SusC/RagA family TonB-linked outer membrane protein [Mediterranea sp.]|jgi:TonB-linked SusC/RagA family outer membrane protein|nr:SusC/RagA family TonB-linked outer membrane protein [Mediterranea sp.]
MNVKRTIYRCLRRQVCALAGLFFAVTSFAQDEMTVTGKVTDTRGEAVIGASVVVKGSSQGTITNIDGEYSIGGVRSSSTLLFSFIGYREQEVPVEGRSTINVTLQEDVQALDEVVVVGYGSLSRKELSSSIVQVDKSKFMQGPMNNPMEMLTGKVAGLTVNTTSPADPNGGSSLQIRGATSLQAGNDPLVVIDGVAGGDIRNLAAQDIESITVLKDAASSAIYGTRGANGVVLVTTRKGTSEQGRTQVTYDSWFGVNFAKAKPDILSPDEFRRSRRGTDYGYDTDWYSLLMRDFSYDNNQYLSIDGSLKNGYYGASINYIKRTGLDIRSGREEFGARFVVNQRVMDGLLELNASLSGRRVNEEWGNGGLFDAAMTMNPTMPVHNADGTYFQPTSPTGATNPVQTMKEITNNGQRAYLLGTAEAKLNLLRTEKHLLNTTLSYSLHYNDLKQQYYTPSTAGESYWNGYKGRANVTYQKWWINRVEWTANYSLDLGEHKLKAMAGYSYEENQWERLFAENSDFNFDNIAVNDLAGGSYLGEGKALMDSGKSIDKLIGVFGRVNYNWRDLIYASASIRHEGATKFGANHKWGSFPSVSLAWEMANMEFLSPYKDEVQSLKPRISYGVTGRSGFDNYLSLATYSSYTNAQIGNNATYLMDGAWVTGYAPSNNANPNLAWEKSTSLNIGVDFALFNRVRGSVEWFERQSKDLLYNYTAPQPPYVFSTILVNVGTTKNTGVELSLEGDVFTQTPVKWTTGVNYSYGTTKLTKLSDSFYKASYVDLYLKAGVGTNEYFFRVQEGSKVGQFYGYQYAGMSEDGLMLVYDNDGGTVPVGQADPAYKRYIGNAAPTSFLSWNNTLRWKSFDLSLSFNGAFGFNIFNMRRYGMGLKGAGTDNVLRSAYLEDAYITTGGGVISSFFLEKGDFFKLDNVTLGYNFTPKPNKYIAGLRVYATAKNLFTLTGYSGNDPSIVTLNGLTPGVDENSAYPQATQVSVGLNIRFK